MFLKEIEVVQNEKYGQKNVDNHSGQHYNVEQFRVAAHNYDLVNKKSNRISNISAKRLSSVLLTRDNYLSTEGGYGPIARNANEDRKGNLLRYLCGKSLVFLLVCGNPMPMLEHLSEA